MKAKKMLWNKMGKEVMNGNRSPRQSNVDQLRDDERLDTDPTEHHRYSGFVRQQTVN